MLGCSPGGALLLPGGGKLGCSPEGGELGCSPEGGAAQDVSHRGAEAMEGRPPTAAQPLTPPVSVCGLRTSNTDPPACLGRPVSAVGSPLRANSTEGKNWPFPFSAPVREVPQARGVLLGAQGPNTAALPPPKA